MAFDSTSSITLSKPTFHLYVNDWNLSSTLPLPIVQFIGNNFIVATTLSLPTVVFTGVTEQNFSIAITTPLPTTQFGASASIEGVLIRTMRLPQVSFLVENPLTYTSTNILPSITAVIRASSEGAYTFSNSLRNPVLSFISALTATTTKQTWVFNTITGAHSRFTNYDFNSYFKLGANYYGVASNGDIYQITGDVDYSGEAGEATIASEIIFPVSHYDEQQNKMCSDAFVYGRGDGDLEVVFVTDEQQERTGFYVNFDGREGMHRKRVKIPKGMLGNAWQFKLKNVDGSAFDINAFEVFVRTVQRII